MTGRGRSTREEFLKNKALEEARKAGTAPAEVDEEGREINPHIPSYISSAPWYVDIGRPTLSHQRSSTQGKSLTEKEWYQRGARATQAATKYRKGACENCGAMTHKTKDCLDRPRKLGAKWTGTGIRPDELIQSVDLDYEGKRDRWNGYDPSSHQKVIEQYEELEEMRRKLREKEIEEKMRAKAEKRAQGDNGASGDELDIADLSSDSDADDLALEDELKYAEKADMPGQKVDLKTRVTVRNLRLREDTAKYLRNLDPNSAHYDPKTRSMRQNPNQEKHPDELDYAGDNFVRFSGDASNMVNTRVFSWQAYEKGIDVNLEADPTRAALLHKEFQKKKEEVKDSVRDSIIAKYGGEEHLKDAPPKELLLAQTEQYVEYSRQGKLVKGMEKAKARSKYDEDNYGKYGSGHTSVFGSFFDVSTKRWGYACCRSTLRGSYCTGLAGIEAQKEKPTEESIANMPVQKSLKDQHIDRILAAERDKEQAYQQHEQKKRRKE